jgi:hypothetical protein
MDTLLSDPLEDIRTLRSMRLPSYDHILVPCKTFIDQFDRYASTFRRNKYYLTLFPTQLGLPKLSLLDFDSLATARSFVFEHLKEPYDRYWLYASELRDNLYGGSIACDGTVIVAEIAPGYPTAPTTWTNSPTRRDGLPG